MIHYRILPEQKLIAMCNWGKTTVEEIMKFSQDLRNDPDFSQSYDAILDNTHSESVFSYDDIEKLSIQRVDTSKPGGRLAIVAPADISFGMSRMHEIVTEFKSPYKIYVFRDAFSALKWLDREGLDIESIFERIKGETK